MLDTDSFDFTLPFNGVRVRSDKRGEDMTVYIPHECNGMDNDISYTISIDDWEYEYGSRILYKIDK